MTSLVWRPAELLVPGDRLARTIAYKPHQHPPLVAIEYNAPNVRAVVESNDKTHVGWQRVVFRVGSTRIARTWAPESIVAIDATESQEV